MNEMEYELGSVGYFTRRLKLDAELQLLAVKTARRGGATWAAIAKELGVSRQAAAERFTPLLGGDLKRVWVSDPVEGGDPGTME